MFQLNYAVICKSGPFLYLLVTSIMKFFALKCLLTPYCVCPSAGIFTPDTVLLWETAVHYPPRCRLLQLPEQVGSNIITDKTEKTAFQHEQIYMHFFLNYCATWKICSSRLQWLVSLPSYQVCVMTRFCPFLYLFNCRHFPLTFAYLFLLRL